MLTRWHDDAFDARVLRVRNTLLGDAADLQEVV